MIFLTFSSFFNLSSAQTLTANAANPQNAEVGLANYYNFYVSNLPSNATIVRWEFSSDTDVCVSGNPSGYIDHFNTSTYSVNTSASTYTVLATWGDCCITSKTVRLIVIVTYQLSGSTTNYTVSGSQTVNLYRIPCNIAISGPNTAPNCCPTTLTYTAGDTGDADRYLWTVTSGNATILTGANTKTITVNPNIGNFTLSFQAWRYTGHPSYVHNTQKTVTRTDLSATLSVPLYGGNPQNFICKGTGLNATLLINSGGCTGETVTWFAPNCTVTSLGSNVYKIVPDNSLTIGSIVNVYAKVKVNNCEVTTKQFDLRVLDSQAPTVPNGYLYYTYDGDFCTADILYMHFSDTSFVNGDIIVTPDFMPGPGDAIHYKPNVIKKFSVCNKNLCTNALACKDYYIYPPAPCADPYAKTVGFNMYPNPSSTETSIENSSDEEGTYQIYNINGILIKSGKIKSKEKANVNTSSLKDGQYTVVFTTNTKVISKQLIIKK